MNNSRLPTFGQPGYQRQRQPTVDQARQDAMDTGDDVQMEIDDDQMDIDDEVVDAQAQPAVADAQVQPNIFPNAIGYHGAPTNNGYNGGPFNQPLQINNLQNFIPLAPRPPGFFSQPGVSTFGAPIGSNPTPSSIGGRKSRKIGSKTGRRKSRKTSRRKSRKTSRRKSRKTGRKK